MPKPPKHTGTSDNTEPGASTGAAGTDTASTQTKDPELVAFGLQVRARRDEIGISQEDLAGRTGLHVTYISRIERGIQNPTLKSLLRIAEALNSTLDQLSTKLTSQHPSIYGQPLTQAENETIRLLSLGSSPKEIATQQNTDLRTVNETIRSASIKTGAKNTVHLVALAGK